jgi:hypothetical protein
VHSPRLQGLLSANVGPEKIAIGWDTPPGESPAPLFATVKGDNIQQLLLSKETPIPQKKFWETTLYWAALMENRLAVGASLPTFFTPTMKEAIEATSDGTPFSLSKKAAMVWALYKYWNGEACRQTLRGLWNGECLRNYSKPPPESLDAIYGMTRSMHEWVEEHLPEKFVAVPVCVLNKNGTELFCDDTFVREGSFFADILMPNGKQPAIDDQRAQEYRSMLSWARASEHLHINEAYERTAKQTFGNLSNENRAAIVYMITSGGWGSKNQRLAFVAKWNNSRVDEAMEMAQGEELSSHLGIVGLGKPSETLITATQLRMMKQIAISPLVGGC